MRIIKKSDAYISITLILLTLFTFPQMLMAEEITLLEVTRELQDGESRIHDDQGRIYMRAVKRVYAAGNNDLWVINSIVYSWVRMKALNENEDYMGYARINGTSDRNTRAAPTFPTYNTYRHDADFTVYSGYQKVRVSWIKRPFINKKRDLHCSFGGSTDIWASTPSENPFDPYSYAWGESEWHQYPGGSVNTD